jgi:hypothetical protein
MTLKVFVSPALSQLQVARMRLLTSPLLSASPNLTTGKWVNGFL